MDVGAAALEPLPTGHADKKDNDYVEKAPPPAPHRFILGVRMGGEAEAASFAGGMGGM
jgi:hypothetical protein